METTEVVKLPISKLVPAIMLAVEIGNVADKMGRNVGMSRFGHLLQLMDEMAAMEGIRLEDVIAQAKDIDAAERAELHALVAEKLVLADKQLEMVIEEALGLIVDAAAIIQRAVLMVKNFKAEKAE